MSRDGIIYMLTGDKHANHLAVSVLSLREHWDGPVALIAGCDKGETICRHIEQDKRLGEIEVIRWDAPTRRTAKKPGQQYANKCEMGRLSPFDRTIFLDADTLVVGDFTDMFPEPGTEQVRLTTFADWKTTGNLMRSRIERWRNEMPKEVALMAGHPYPAINTGVIGFTRLSTKWFKTWKTTTLKRVEFICDEIAAQLIFPWHPHCVLDERWNCSVVYSWDRHGAEAANPDPRIWHGHGFKFVKKETGRQLWVPYYRRAIDGNYAKIADWTNNVQKPPKKYLGQEAEP